jgi:O-antigen ligase
MILSRLRETYWQAFHTASLKVLLLSCALLFAGFVCSRALVSIGMIGIVLAALLNIKNCSLKVFVERKELLLLTLLFWGVFVSGLWSDDKNSWMNFTRIHLPYLFLPLAFGALPRLESKQLKAIVLIYVLVMCISGAFVLARYLLHYEEINESMLMGGVIPMPYSHIRYSLMLVFAFCVAVYFAKDYLLYGATAFLFLLLHILSVRSGLFALYVSIVVMLTIWIIRERQWMRASLAVLFIIAAAGIAFNTIPSLKNRINYMRYDIINYKYNQPIDASDGMRFRSWKGALEVAKKAPLIGVGYGDLQNEMSAYYNENFPELELQQHKLPHNQFLWWLVSTGWIGVLVFSTTIAFPFIKYFNTKIWLWHCFFAIIFSSFIWEATLEEQMGTGFFSIWILLLMQIDLKKQDE